MDEGMDEGMDEASMKAWMKAEAAKAMVVGEGSGSDG